MPNHAVASSFIEDNRLISGRWGNVGGKPQRYENFRIFFLTSYLLLLPYHLLPLTYYLPLSLSGTYWPYIVDAAEGLTVAVIHEAITHTDDPRTARAAGV